MCVCVSDLCFGHQFVVSLSCAYLFSRCCGAFVFVASCLVFAVVSVFFL